MIEDKKWILVLPESIKNRNLVYQSQEKVKEMRVLKAIANTKLILKAFKNIPRYQITKIGVLDCCGRELAVPGFTIIDSLKYSIPYLSDKRYSSEIFQTIDAAKTYLEQKGKLSYLEDSFYPMQEEVKSVPNISLLEGCK